MSPSRVRDVAGRLLAAVAIGGAVAGTAYLCAYLTMRGHPNYRSVEAYVQHELDLLQKAIEQHQRDTGHLPVTLAELKDLKSYQRRDGQVVDPWGHPYQYQVQGESYTLYSFGRDGRPGGDELDADIYPTSTGPPVALPTLRQFTLDLPTRGVQWTCLLAGACAGLICILPARNRRGAGFLARVGATMAGTVVIAVVISSLHIPTGH